MTPLLTPGVRDKLDAVLVPNPSTGRTRLAWLQREATAITPSAILAEIGKLTVLRASAHLEPRAVGVTAFTVDDASRWCGVWDRRGTAHVRSRSAVRSGTCTVRGRDSAGRMT